MVTTACRPAGSADVVTISYAVTMIPDWKAAIANVQNFCITPDWDPGSTVKSQTQRCPPGLSRRLALAMAAFQSGIMVTAYEMVTTSADPAGGRPARPGSVASPSTA